MQALIDGKINFIVECNPLLGDLAAGLVKDVLAGKTVEEGDLRRGGRQLHPGAGRRGHRFTQVPRHWYPLNNTWSASSGAGLPAVGVPPHRKVREHFRASPPGPSIVDMQGITISFRGAGPG